MSKGSAPPAPDYTGAAQATAQGNLQNLNAQTTANRPDQYTPWGSSTWTQTPGADGTSSWTNNISLSPSEQAALDSQQKIQQNQSSLAQAMQGQVASQMQNGFTAPSMDSYLGSVPAVSTNFTGFNPSDANSVDQRELNPNSYTSDYHGLNQNFASNAQQNTKFGGGPALNLSFSSGTPGLNTTFQSGANPVNQNFTSTGSQVNTDPKAFTSSAGNVNLKAPQFDQATADAGTQAAYKASTGLLTDQWQQDTKNLDSQLRMQGLTPGTEAYNNAMQNVLRVQGQQQDQLANQAVLTGNQLANTNYASSLAGYQASNAAQAQAFDQGLNKFGAANQALGQQFGQDLQGFGANNAAQQQKFTQDATDFGLTNDARNQSFSNSLNSFNSTNNAANQQFQNNLSGYNSQNNALNTQYQNDLAKFTANNNASSQALQNGLSQYAAALQGQGVHNAAVGQAFNQDLATYGTTQAAQQNSNAAQEQSYQQAMQNYQTSYQSAYQNYLQPLNSMNAVLTGQQVNMPQMPGFTAAGYTPGADLSGAASATGQYNSGVYAQNSANANSMLGTVGTLGAAAIMAY